MTDKLDLPSAEKAEVDKSQIPRILIADDSRLVRKTATKMLQSKFDIVLVEDGEEAWQTLLVDDSIQVVFTDLGMPNLDGYGLIQRIRQSENDEIRDLPVIVITGAAEDEAVRRKAFEVGATDFVTKPFKSTEIIARAEAHASYRQDKDTFQKNTDIDLLTGTLNAKGLHEKLEKDVSFINRHGQNLALVIFELDNFKAIAAKLNQQATDKIIKHVAKVLGNAIRKEDSFGRFEFAKFVTILPMAKTDGVIQLAKRLCEVVKSFKINVVGEDLSLTMSVGIAAVRKGGSVTSSILLQSAEQALANAKAVGPGEVQLLKLEDQQTTTTTTATTYTFSSIDSLLEAIERGQSELPSEQMQDVLNRLAPLVALMSEGQKQQMLQKR